MTSVRSTYLVTGESEQDRHAVGGIPVVVGNEDSSRGCTHVGAGRLERGGIARGQLAHERQRDDELGSQAEAGTRGLHTAAMQFDHVMDQGQADSQPFPGAARRTFHQRENNEPFAIGELPFI